MLSKNGNVCHLINFTAVICNKVAQWIIPMSVVMFFLNFACFPFSNLVFLFSLDESKTKLTNTGCLSTDAWKSNRWLEILSRIALIRLLIVTNLVAKCWKCENCFCTNLTASVASYKETFLNFWYKLNCDY